MTHNIDRIQQALATCGWSWEDLCASADAVILFGSQAAGCSTQNSDVDLLCLGTGSRRSSAELHLVWVSPESVSDHQWLTSEFGGHVAKYGIWLKGAGSFSPIQPPSENAICRKLRLITDRAEMLNDEWADLSKRFRSAQLCKLRQDVQRFRILDRGEIVPPTPILDAQWVHERQKQDFIEEAFLSHQIIGRLVTALLRCAC